MMHSNSKKSKQRRLYSQLECAVTQGDRLQSYTVLFEDQRISSTQYYGLLIEKVLLLKIFILTLDIFNKTVCFCHFKNIIQLYNKTWVSVMFVI